VRPAHLLAGALLACFAPSCALAIGVQNTPLLAAKELCGCPLIQGFNLSAACQEGVEARLEAALPADRDRWLQDFAAKCAGNCGAALDCFYEAPACVVTGDPCQSSLECCSHKLCMMHLGNGTCE
jgi:hypothetical protein